MCDRIMIFFRQILLASFRSLVKLFPLLLARLLPHVSSRSSSLKDVRVGGGIFKDKNRVSITFGVRFKCL